MDQDEDETLDTRYLKFYIGMLLIFILNIKTMIKMKFTRLSKVIFQIQNNEKRENVIIPKEGKQGSMHEGMVYIMFHSDNLANEIDSIYRIYWISVPKMGLTILDTYFLSTKFPSNDWNQIITKKQIFNLDSKKSLKINADENRDLKFHFSGSWETGYVLTFEDKIHRLQGEFNLKAIENAVLTYNNGKYFTQPSSNVYVYDAFGLKSSGTLNVGSKQYSIQNARSVIEQAHGIYSVKNIKGWQWINLQWKNGAAHFFDNTLLINENLIPSGEGAIAFQDTWLHYPRRDFDVIKIKSDKLTGIDQSFPIEWKLVTKEAEFELISIKHHSWKQRKKIETILSFFKKEIQTQYVMDHIIKFKGTINGNEIDGFGTIEYIICQ